METLDILRKAVGGNETAFMLHGFPHMVVAGYLDKQRMIIYPRLGMSLEEKLRIPVDQTNRRAFLEEMLTVVYTMVRFEIIFSKNKSFCSPNTNSILIQLINEFSNL